MKQQMDTQTQSHGVAQVPTATEVIGRVTFVSGETMEFTDPQEYLQMIREELPYFSTTGFRYYTLSDDPELKKAVDDILLGFIGEENPRRACNYGMTEKGLEALRHAADPNAEHTYTWFVMTDCNTPKEQILRDLSLEEAIRLYEASGRPEKRIGVTKDGIATVDLVHTGDRGQQFFQDHEKMESFQNDSVIAKAAEQLHQRLSNPEPDQVLDAVRRKPSIGGMTFGPCDF